MFLLVSSSLPHLHNNKTNTVKVALSKVVYVHRILKIKWEQLFVAGRYWASERRKTLTENITFE